MTKNLNQLLTLKQVSKVLNISSTSLYRLTAARKIIFIKVGKNIRFREKDIISYLNKNQINNFN